jgi:hypothetical protein
MGQLDTCKYFYHDCPSSSSNDFSDSFFFGISYFSKEKSFNGNIALLLVFVYLQGQAFEAPVGEEVEVNEDDREDKAPHLVETLRREVGILHAVLEEIGHLDYNRATSCSRLKMIVTFRTWLMRQ